MKNRGIGQRKAPDIESAMSELVFDRIDAVLAEILKEISLADLAKHANDYGLNGNTCSLFKNSFKRNDKLEENRNFPNRPLVGGIQKSLLNFLNRFGGRIILLMSICSMRKSFMMSRSSLRI